ncbi:tetratricopeptide repeat protein [Melittangium boletus]|uniref:Uncharacterized protein n=1 Tax=Melittangium boletus DSM 14713 TaxID=1294270 RepID=A0A250I6D9_9BACT|nr:tetratricopeptide repeat protein [Melittangium boletus]ATB26760.1 hypothetical protein MEBOL_000194 [Melittangium boletus DSM 14713]
MASVSRTIGLTALIAIVPATLRAESLPKGSYQTDVWGRVELNTEHDRVVGYAAEGAACGLAPRAKVLEGEWQGRVLVGQITVCLQGASCPAQASLPLLAFLGSEDGTFTTYVRPQAGCMAPGAGLGGLVVFSPAAPGEGTPVQSGPAVGGRVKRNPQAAKVALDRGDQLMKEKNWSAAITEFERSIALNEQSWAAFLSLGTAQLMRNEPRAAIEALDKARVINKREPLIYYHLACAYSRLGDKKQALSNLEQAVAFGLAINPEPEDDGLSKLLGSDLGSSARYTLLMQRAANNSKASAGRRQSPGP